jgi:predicted metal-dependent RNase
MTVQTIVHRGTKEIGDNCVEVRTDSSRLIIEVGMPLSQRERGVIRRHIPTTSRTRLASYR